MSDIVILDEEQSSHPQSNRENLSSENATKVWFMESLNNASLSFQNLKLKDKLILYRLLSTMLNSGMGLVKWVWVLEKQEKNPVFKNILSTFIVELKEWKTLSECLELYPKSFSNAEVWVIKSGEKTWKLNTVLTGLAEQTEKVSSISGKLKSAMMYPIMIMFVVSWVIFVMMTSIVPKLLEIFYDKSVLPASTKALIAVSDIFVNFWYLIILSGLGIYVFISYWKRTPNWKYNFDNALLHLPVFGKVMRKVILSKFARIFSGLISSWVSVVESLRIVSDAVGNEVYRQRILLLTEDVKGGMKIWESLDGDKLFPDIMIQMIQVWEQTAKLDQTVVKIADFYDEQVDNTIWSINKLLEPIIIVFLAVVVWFIAMAIMQPIMSLADTVANS